MKKSMLKIVLSMLVVMIAGFSAMATAAETGVSLAAQKTYVYEAKKPSANYPDPTGVKLTDGKFAVDPAYFDPAWVGIWDIIPIVVNLDLGSSQLISEVRTHFLAGNAGTKWPTMISVSVSEDNETWSDTVSLGVFDEVPATGTVRWYSVSDINLTGRWVRVSFTPIKAGANIFFDEIEVY